ncbi:hypothetical protein [Lacticaseibacillus suihuaensis]
MMKIVEDNYEVRQEAVKAMNGLGLSQDDHRIEIAIGEMWPAHKYPVYTYHVISLKTGEVVLSDSVEARSF